MAELMLINPKRRRRTTTRKRRRRNPWYDQTRRHSKAAKLGWSRRRRGTRRRRNPIAGNPRRRRRNPARGGIGGITNMIMPAATAAAGAIGIDALLGFVPFPENLKTGPLRYVVKGGAAIGVGMLLRNMKLVKPKTAELFTLGALTVVLSDAGKDMIARFMPGFAAKAGFAPSVAGLGYYGDEDLLGLGYGGAGYTGVDEEMGGLGYYYGGEDMMGLGADEDIEEFEL